MKISDDENNRITTTGRIEGAWELGLGTIHKSSHLLLLKTDNNRLKLLI